MAGGVSQTRSLLMHTVRFCSLAPSPGCCNHNEVRSLAGAPQTSETLGPTWRWHPGGPRLRPPACAWSPCSGKTPRAKCAPPGVNTVTSVVRAELFLQDDVLVGKAPAAMGEDRWLPGLAGRGLMLPACCAGNQGTARR